MKFLDLINEDEQSEWNKLFKKTQLVFKTLRKGRIRTKSGVVFSYEIPEDSDISVASSRGEEPTPYVRCESIKIKEESKECSDISYGMFGELIKRKFGHFGILFVFSVYPEDIEKYEHKTINEDNDRRIKRARTIYKALKKGLFNRSEYGSIKYILPDEYDVHIRSIDDVVIIKVGDEESENPVIFLYSDDDGRDDKPTKVGPKYYYTFVEKLGHKYFEDFGIKFIC